VLKEVSLAIREVSEVEQKLLTCSLVKFLAVLLKTDWYKTQNSKMQGCVEATWMTSAVGNGEVQSFITVA
jgi:hypothetical protein